jgi:hypothetical protein
MASQGQVQYRSCSPKLLMPPDRGDETIGEADGDASERGASRPPATSAMPSPGRA